ncbi:MAG: hypothetical protein KDB02_12780 [Acidimicrobiales bacterium]|nr:hypothetical protein [Acidimicrobiales bacterium]
MSLPPLDTTLPTESIHVVPWPDPVIDRLGHDPRSTYAETFWLPVLGPSTFLVLRHIATRLDTHPDGFDLCLLDGARSLGLGTRGGRNAPFVRALARSIQFKVCSYDDRGTLTVRRKLAPLTRHQLARLGPDVRDLHDAWQRAEAARPGPEDQKRRARRLALSLAELGETDEAIEHQLHRWRLHPALASEALRWARERQRDPERIPAPPVARTGQTFSPSGEVA